jgi:topoisomerase-4 subunit A
MSNTLSNEQEELEISQYGHDSYLNYSMYVITDRSLPHVADGLKPVHRRILFAMNELRLDHQAKFKKSARTVGDTLGKYHPHGDSACYEAMVLMAQSFSTRYPLINGQGNWGSIDDPKSFAAMRYTESKMTPYAGSLLKEIHQDSVNWKPNFDGTMKEPELLPAQLPNILLNGSTGIAVGMATDIPPHNMEEVVNACVTVLSKKRTSDDDILEMIPMPDFPGGAEIISSKEKIEQAYKTGRGSIRVRATYEKDKNMIYITSLPYRVSANKIIEEIDNQVKLKKLPVTDMLDKSDKDNPIRIALAVKGDAKQELVMNHLFATTNLESTIKINLNMIGQDGVPRVKSLPEVVREWCECRQDMFERKTRYRLEKVLARIHILDGLLIAYASIDEVVRIIREEDVPRQALMDTFSLSETQAKAILELRLRQIAKLEENALQEEHGALTSERDHLQALLADDKKIKRAMIAELKNASKPHFDKRRTTHSEKENAVVAAASTLINDENTTVVLSENYWLRSVKGHNVDLSKLNYKAGDKYHSHIETRSVKPSIIMASDGRFFGIPTHTLPNGKTTGEPLSSRVTLEPGANIVSMLDYDEKTNILLVTQKGNGFQVPMKSLDSRNRKGKQVLNLTTGDSSLKPVKITDEDELVILTKAGRLVIIPINEINVSNKSQGVRLVNIDAKEFENSDDAVSQILPLKKMDSFSVYSGKRKFVIDDARKNHYRAKRARRGVFFEHSRKNLSLEG